MDRRDHPNALRLREILDAIAAGDVEAAYLATHEDLHNVNDIGAGPWREQHGREEFFAFFADFCALFERPFNQEVLDVLAGTTGSSPSCGRPGLPRGRSSTTGRSISSTSTKTAAGPAAHPRHGPGLPSRVLGRRHRARDRTLRRVTRRGLVVRGVTTSPRSRGG